MRKGKVVRPLGASRRATYFEHLPDWVIENFGLKQLDLFNSTFEHLLLLFTLPGLTEDRRATYNTRRCRRIKAQGHPVQ